MILSLHWNEIHNYLAAGNYMGFFEEVDGQILKIQYILAGNYSGVSERGSKKHPYDYPYRGTYIIYSSEFNWIFSENATFFSEAPPPTPYPITNTSLHDINIDNWHK